jgi:hypothetical protein
MASSRKDNLLESVDPVGRARAADGPGAAASADRPFAHGTALSAAFLRALLSPCGSRTALAPFFPLRASRGGRGGRRDGSYCVFVTAKVVHGCEGGGGSRQASRVRLPDGDRGPPPPVLVRPRGFDPVGLTLHRMKGSKFPVVVSGGHPWPCCNLVSPKSHPPLSSWLCSNRRRRPTTFRPALLLSVGKTLRCSSQVPARLSIAQRDGTFGGSQSDPPPSHIALAS